MDFNTTRMSRYNMTLRRFAKWNTYSTNEYESRVKNIFYFERLWFHFKIGMIKLCGQTRHNKDAYTRTCVGCRFSHFLSTNHSSVSSGESISHNEKENRSVEQRNAVQLMLRTKRERVSPVTATVVHDLVRCQTIRVPLRVGRFWNTRKHIWNNCKVSLQTVQSNNFTCPKQ